MKKRNKRITISITTFLFLVADMIYIFSTIHSQNFFSMLLFLILIPCILFSLTLSGLSSLIFNQSNKRLILAAVSGAIMGVILSVITSVIMQGQILADLSENTQRLAGNNENLEISNISINSGVGSIIMIGIFTFALVYLSDRFIFKNRGTHDAF